MTRDEIREVAHEAAEHAVQEVFLRYGIDPSSPIEVQKDFAYLRRSRAASESVGPIVKRTLIGILVTGAFHEDGLADVADGFGGGWDHESKLGIMRDSRIGTFGVVAVVLSLGLRATAVAALAEPAAVASAVIMAGMASRAAILFVQRGLPPARTDGLGAGAGVPTVRGVAAATLLNLAAAVALLPLPVAGAAVVAIAIVVWGVAVLARRQIGGFTGDVLGAVQQVSEIAALLAVVVLSGH